MKKEGKWAIDIGLSQGCCFGTQEKKLIMHLFKSSLDNQVERAKKSHRIVLICVWKNLGCRPVDERKAWKEIQEAVRKLNEVGKFRLPLGVK